MSEVPMSDILVNRVANSGLLTLDLESLSGQVPYVLFDLKGFLFMELMLKEKDYREALKVHDWEVYRNKAVTISCTSDAIIPMWAYMLAASYLQPVARFVTFGPLEKLREQWLLHQVEAIDTEAYRNQRVVVKGCGEDPVGESVYVAATAKLLPVVKSLMYGEPCSTVPIFKSKVSG